MIFWYAGEATNFKSTPEKLVCFVYIEQPERFICSFLYFWQKKNLTSRSNGSKNAILKLFPTQASFSFCALCHIHVFIRNMHWSLASSVCYDNKFGFVVIFHTNWALYLFWKTDNLLAVYSMFDGGVFLLISANRKIS